ncbi:MAG: hypothetical protein RL095_2241 [Verrucomicrobiota bacterium]|jgi:hypothetical protein
MPQLQLSLHAAPLFSWSFETAGLALVDGFTLDNGGGEALSGLTLRLESTPPRTAPWEIQLDSLAAGEKRRFDATGFRLAAASLAAQREREFIDLKLSVLCGGREIASSSSRCELLAAGQWSGSDHIAESLACFVTPNHPALAEVLKSASTALDKATGSGALDGYLSGQIERPLAIAAAIHAALAARQLSYAVPPASFEAQGQKIRLPHETLADKIGCCLDTTVLWAALLEQAGLAPLILLDQNHAWLGFWLGQRRLGETLVADPERLRNLFRLGEIALLETTSHGASFDEARRAGLSRLEKPQGEFLAIDLASARLCGFTPLPIGAAAQPASAAADAAKLVLPAAPERPAPLDPRATEPKNARLERWKRRLLDLSLRNRMLNFRDSSGTLRLLPPSLGELEDLLSAEKTLCLLPRPESKKKGGGELPGAEQISEAFSRGRCLSACDEEEFDKRGTKIYREARSLEEETGSNSLYLALGLLAWRETPKADKPRLAPLLLIPVYLSRRARGEGFELEIGDDEPRINSTLVEFLRLNYGIDLSVLTADLPTDDKGLDVARIFAHARQAIAAQAGWELRDEAWIGFFSFQKYLLWADLNRPDQKVLSHPVVQGLLSREAPQHLIGDELPSPAAMDAELARLCAPLPADSSQLAAVAAAGAKRSFVLEGPPGTGKSQTITNLITHALCLGQRVLFVAEKNAALEVVQRRLAAQGLAPWCLELHARKADKKAVVAQLKLALEAAEGAKAAPADPRAAALPKLEASRADLVKLAEELHQPRRNGRSLYALTEELARLGDGPLSGDTPPAQLDPEAWKSLLELLAETDSAWPGLPQIKGHPLAALRCQQIPTDFSAIAKLQAMQNAVTAFGIAAPLPSLDQVQALAALAAPLARRFPAELLQGPGINPACEGAFRDYAAQLDEMKGLFDLKILQQADLDSRLQDLRSSQSSWFLPAWMGRRAARKFLAGFAKATLPDDGPALVALMEKLCATRDAETALRRALASASLPATLVDSLLAAPAQAADFVEAEVDVRDLCAKLKLDPASLVAFIGQDRRSAAATLLEAQNSARAALETADAALAPETSLLAPCVDFAKIRITQLESWLAATSEFAGWCAWNRLRSRLLDAGLASLVAAIEAGRLSPGQFKDAALRSLLSREAEGIIAASPRLASFFGPEEERKRNTYRQLREELQKLCREAANAAIASRARDAAASTALRKEKAVLLNEIGKQTRHKPARRLFEEAPALLAALKPCLLMSPASVAQHLSPDMTPFDLVVFDEASQIPPWDAVGVLARGDAAIVVGDSKQLPPTSFFARQEDADEAPSIDAEDYEDLESVLDEMHAAGFRSSRLLWHYRSKSEDLIAFSNARYYEGKLFTFPAAASSPALTLRRCAGVYDRAGTRANRVEAQAVVADAIARLKKAGSPDKASLGIVTFSQAQQELVLDLLDAAYKDDPELEAYSDAALPEPFFVKNLESVQGDERDVILFSIGYGPDKDGKVAMNFGPLNRLGGERRLNVAITRARREISVHCSLRPDQIDPSRTKARGVRDLRDFLAYAEARSAAALTANRGDALEEALAGHLEAKGWKLTRHFGQGGWRMPLALHHPQDPGRFLLGIDTDGPASHLAPTLADRECVRPAALSSLGWQVHRVSCLDLRKNPAALAQSIHDKAKGMK